MDNEHDRDPPPDTMSGRLQAIRDAWNDIDCAECGNTAIAACSSCDVLTDAIAEAQRFERDARPRADPADLLALKDEVDRLRLALAAARAGWDTALEAGGLAIRTEREACARIVDGCAAEAWGRFHRYNERGDFEEAHAQETAAEALDDAARVIRSPTSYADRLSARLPGDAS